MLHNTREKKAVIRLLPLAPLMVLLPLLLLLDIGQQQGAQACGGCGCQNSQHAGTCCKMHCKKPKASKCDPWCDSYCCAGNRGTCKSEYCQNNEDPEQLCYYTCLEAVNFKCDKKCNSECIARECIKDRYGDEKMPTCPAPKEKPKPRPGYPGGGPGPMPKPSDGSGGDTYQTSREKSHSKEKVSSKSKRKRDVGEDETDRQREGLRPVMTMPVGPPPTTLFISRLRPVRSAFAYSQLERVMVDMGPQRGLVDEVRDWASSALQRLMDSA